MQQLGRIKTHTRGLINPVGRSPRGAPELALWGGACENQGTGWEDAHREDDIAVSFIEVAMGTQRHQRQLHFLEGQGVWMGYIPSPSSSEPPPSTLLFGTGHRAGERGER